MGIAIITGASSGIGKEFAIQLDRQGTLDELWLIARSEDKMNVIADSLKTKCKVLSLDLENETAIDSLEEELKQSRSVVDLCINSAGFGLNGDFRELDCSEQLNMIDLNCRSVVQVSHIVIPFMESGSHFINI